MNSPPLRQHIHSGSREDQYLLRILDFRFSLPAFCSPGFASQPYTPIALRWRGGVHGGDQRRASAHAVKWEPRQQATRGNFASQAGATSD
jgi:hypothetical protein